VPAPDDRPDQDEAPATAEGGTVDVILVRHGATEWSGDRYMGRLDVPLSQAGSAQAEALADVLAGQRIDRIWSSPLSRALATSGPLARRTGLAVTAMAELAEMDYGEMQGVAKTDRRINIRRDHAVKPIPGGESLTDVALRAQQACTALGRHLSPGQVGLVVSHYRVSQFVLGSLFGRTFEQIIDEPGYRPENGSAYLVTCTTDGDHMLRAIKTRWLTPTAGGGAQP
jgi:probable phosphoglycerate mutase